MKKIVLTLAIAICTFSAFAGEEKIAPKLLKENNYKNKQQVPTIQKIVINRGLGDASQNTKILESSLNELSEKLCIQ